MIEQVFIAVFGVTAVWLSQSRSAKRRKYAPLFGIVSQPFWFYTAWAHEQWGVFFLSFLYSYSWIMGIYNQWLVKDGE